MAIAIAVTGTAALFALRVGVDSGRVQKAVETTADKLGFGLADLDSFLGIDDEDVLVWRKRRPACQPSGFLLFAEQERQGKVEIGSDSLRRVLTKWVALEPAARQTWLDLASQD